MSSTRTWMSLTWEASVGRPSIILFPAFWFLPALAQPPGHCALVRPKKSPNMLSSMWNKNQLIEASTSISLSDMSGYKIVWGPSIPVARCHRWNFLKQGKQPELTKRWSGSQTPQAKIEVPVCSSSGWGIRCSNKRHDDESESSQPLVFQQQWSEHHPTSAFLGVKHVHTSNNLVFDLQVVAIYPTWIQKIPSLVLRPNLHRDWGTKAITFTRLNKDIHSPAAIPSS